jgi:hypothetical protein
MASKKKAKYRAIRTGGYASRFEAKVAEQVRAELAPGELMHEQVTVVLGCGAKLVLDFAVSVDGKIVRYIEAKGMETPVWRLKLRMLRHERPDIAGILQIVTAKPRKKRKTPRSRGEVA